MTDGSTVSVSVEAVSGTGTVTRVELLVDGVVVATDTGDPRSGPYQLNWTAGPIGSRQLRARVTDSSGGATTSAPITVTIADGLTGDVNGDGVVDATDLALVRGQFGRSGSAITTAGADLDDNGRGDAADLAAVTRALTP